MEFKSIGRRTALAAALAVMAFTPMASGALAQSGDGRDRRVNIHNETGYTIVRFYASNSGRNNWEEDILGSGVLPSGRSVRINIDDGSGACLYDFKAVFSDGDELVRYRINVCEISNYRYTR
ncbi:MAG TPA: hypothetical protein VGB49_09820 [Caulobacteraceae bacterium]|jgi:hypothetical protein